MSMRVTVAPVPVEFDPETGIFGVQLRRPGLVRHVGFKVQERLVAVAGEAQFEERLHIYAEMTQDGPLENRTFAVLLPGKFMKLKDGYRADYVGTAVSAVTGSIAHLYELKAVS
jgi:hypothetical protein